MKQKSEEKRRKRAAFNQKGLLGNPADKAGRRQQQQLTYQMDTVLDLVTYVGSKKKQQFQDSRNKNNKAIITEVVNREAIHKNDMQRKIGTFTSY